MSFPERRSLAHDNRDLWRENRKSYRTRDVSNASIAPGEGALDIVDANGNVLYTVGSQGGKHGLLRNVPGVGWRTLDEDAQVKVDWLNGVVSTRFTAVEDEVDTLATDTDSRFTNAWASINAKADASSVDSRFTNAWAAIDSKASSDSVDSRFTNIWASVDATSGRLSTLEQWRTVVENQIIGLNQEIQTLKQRVTALEQAGNTT